MSTNGSQLSQSTQQDHNIVKVLTETITSFGVYDENESEQAEQFAFNVNVIISLNQKQFEEECLPLLNSNKSPLFAILPTNLNLEIAKFMKSKGVDYSQDRVLLTFLTNGLPATMKIRGGLSSDREKEARVETLRRISSTLKWLIFDMGLSMNTLIPYRNGGYNTMSFIFSVGTNAIVNAFENFAFRFLLQSGLIDIYAKSGSLENSAIVKKAFDKVSILYYANQNRFSFEEPDVIYAVLDSKSKNSASICGILLYSLSFASIYRDTLYMQDAEGKKKFISNNSFMNGVPLKDVITNYKRFYSSEGLANVVLKTLETCIQFDIPYMSMLVIYESGFFDGVAISDADKRKYATLAFNFASKGVLRMVIEMWKIKTETFPSVSTGSNILMKTL